MGHKLSTEVSIDIHELTQAEQEDENRRRYPNQIPGKNANSEFLLLYFITLTKKHPKIKKRFEVNYSNEPPNRWFICPYNNRMEQLYGGVQKIPTPVEMEEIVKRNLETFLNKQL